MLDGRISTISRNLSSLGEEIRSAGSKYAKMIRELEIAETKLDVAKKDLQEVELRYRKAEISKATYSKLLEENQNKIEDAETTIDGVLIRLRE
jgi:flagellar motility protein MotE (MotC chaperone)